ncbi:WD40 repeat domain-containing protein [Saccharopolyspora sp. HNM0983]|uniref:WD40 repeat domain-containing protein n=1 Tax=Saccharopolyspora montiporae TaxID=2781240 RepID=A0A929B5V4_9PSEU|nr:WD40 repeat domain-containing protein [Saccharopolyspora sp. HNM0983]MBE9373757.1 WD40 repeat domain-containing protein [Saccharopolyspora sp. HNM0983]
MALSADENTIVTSSTGAGEVRLWDVSDPEHPRPLGHPLPDGEGMSSVAVNADGSTVVTDSAQLRFWNLNDAVHRICATTQNNLGPEEWSRYIPNQPFDPPCA